MRPGTFWADVSLIHGEDGTRGETSVDAETHRYVDAKMETVRAQNDARFAEVLAKIDGLSDRVANLKPPVSLWQIASLLAAAVAAMIGIFGVMADRFDGGIAASGLRSAFQEAQISKDAAQDAKLDQIIEAIGKIPTTPMP